MEHFFLLKPLKQYLLLLILPSLFICQTGKSELETLYFSKMYDDVISKAKEILAYNPSDIEANVFLGESLVQKKEYESALVYLNKGIALEKENLARKLWATFHKGAALYLLDQYSDAQK